MGRGGFVHSRFVRSPAGRRFSNIVGANTVRPRETNGLPYKFVRWRFVCRGYYSPTNYVGPPSLTREGLL